MSNDTEKALEAVAVALKQSTESNQKTAEVSADIAENVRALSAKVIEHDEKFKLYDAKMTEYEDTIVDLTKHMDVLDNEIAITGAQERNLKTLGSSRVMSMLGAPDSPDYVAHSRRFYGHLWSAFKKHFSIGMRRELRRVDYQPGCDFVEAWIPPEGVQGLKDLDDRIKAEEKRDEMRTTIRASKGISEEELK